MRPGALAAVAVAVLAVLAPAAPDTVAAPQRPVVRESVLGRSVQDRAIRLTRVGDPRAARRVLVVGAIHGNEAAGGAVIRALRAGPVPAGVQLWLIPSLNPDGAAAGTRQNAHGVDLNRNFPDGWRAQGRPFDTYYSGPRPLSEPESRLAARLIRRLRPSVTVWYHQALALVDRGTADPVLARRYGRLSGLSVRRLGFLPGVATRWQNRLLPGAGAFVVELPGGPLGPADARRHARAVRAVASAAPQPPAASENAATSSRQKSGMSATTRPHTSVPSRNAGSSTHSAPTFTRSSLMPSDPVARAPTMPAEMATLPPWQMIPIGSPRSWAALTRASSSGSRRILSGAWPPGMTSPSMPAASISEPVTSARTWSPFLPRCASVSEPTETTVAPSSRRRMTVTQYSRSSTPSATRTAYVRPERLSPSTPSSRPSAG
jgi:murein peptide amidase A